MGTNQFFKQIYQNNKSVSGNLPSKTQAHLFLNRLTGFLFPVCKENSTSYDHILEEWEHLKTDFRNLLNPLKQPELHNVNDITEKYFNSIPSIYNILLLDAKAILTFDPAANSLEEVILSYPGFYAIMIYRLSHPLYQMNIPILPRMFSEYAHSKTGIDIHPGANIGNSFFIDHGTGIVIGETTLIGDNVKLYQGVTLGALNVKKEEAKTKRHPTIEDNVIIYAGATILGGNTTIGHNSIIGGNVWLTSSIGPNSVVYHKSEVHLLSREKKKTEPINFII